MKTTTTMAGPIGHPAYRRTMPCTPPSAQTARHLVTTALATWQLDELTDAATLLVSELVGNAIRHTDSHHVLVVISRPAPGLVRIHVADRSRTLPTPLTPGADAERGRGLLTVAAIAHRWGTDPLPWGKRVWCELTIPGAPL